ncbi:hypothetical protein [Arthrobacter sp. PM3]|uniref:hypothetical protein n=1 Tax=Arthrobacter sp. PM3 TaxID=2017685 RepID=UPI000E10D285|nr:hypothetical protein [Arthrobacter sp. PM3]AXJ09637.1 hypothetical protein CFN17_08415 [Arthrobacter sp. PM3]
MTDHDDLGAEESRKEHRTKPHESLASSGAESTRELRDVARRRREAEEKLQHHLLEAKEKPVEEHHHPAAPETEEKPVGD